jgi:hypothetical protein
VGLDPLGIDPAPPPPPMTNTSTVLNPDDITKVDGFGDPTPVCSYT